jgi:deferrochelatase/peroxidase EfeB
LAWPTASRASWADARLPNDRSSRAAHGDLLLQICATDEASCSHALRYLMLGTRSLVVRWLIHGFQQRPGGTVEHGGTGHATQPARLRTGL